jgi:16S rRNA (uracil1498-N3)-methyltransferase
VAGFRPRFFVDDFEGDGLPAWALGSPDLSGTLLSLSPEDSHHAVRVLRLAPGDPCEVVVTGAAYAATVVSTTMPVTARLGARLEGPQAGGTYRMSVGLVQSLERLSLLDWVIEKGTEVGASFFLLIPHGEGDAERRSLARRSRWERIAREAAKQSKQVAVPPVGLYPTTGAALDWLREQQALSIVLDPRASQSLEEVLRPVAPLADGPARPVALWVGPEGGWSPKERDLFAERGIESARLGRGVLRAETAGPVAVAVTRLLLGDW